MNRIPLTQLSVGLGLLLLVIVFWPFRLFTSDVLDTGLPVVCVSLGILLLAFAKNIGSSIRTPKGYMAYLAITGGFALSAGLAYGLARHNGLFEQTVYRKLFMAFEAALLYLVSEKALSAISNNEQI